MKNVLILSLFALFSFTIFAQEKYITKKGMVAFEASVPAFEEVKATNNTVTAIFNADTGEIAALALVKGFRFKNALMEEHFNENYIESDDYPKAKFKGKLEGYTKENTQKEYTINGTLTLHGKSKDISVKASFTKEGDTISIQSEFKEKPEDFDIKIPSVVSKKISDDILINLDFSLTKK